MSELFPENAVEYFVSYYDYYQPEAYIPGRDLYIDKELQMNERIEQERFSTVASLVSRPDVITVGTVSIIYGLNPPEVFQQNHLRLAVGDQADPQDVVRQLVGLQYRRTTGEITRGDIRLRGSYNRAIRAASSGKVAGELAPPPSPAGKPWQITTPGRPRVPPVGRSRWAARVSPPSCSERNEWLLIGRPPTVGQSRRRRPWRNCRARST